MRIAIVGEPMQAAMLGAYMARYCGGKNCVIAPSGEADDGEILLRPDHHRFHAEMRLDPASVSAVGGARPAFAYEIGGKQHQICIPFAPFGAAAAGSEFHQLWLRASALQSQPSIDEFNPAITLHVADSVPANVELSHGIWCTRKDYAEMLLAHAKALGATICSTNEVGQADLTIECSSAGSGATVWNDDRVQIASTSAIPGEEWQAFHNVAKRLLAMLVPLENADAERREFNRLCAAEAERIADFRELLIADNPRKTDRPALRRKIEVFEACGRIPTEDYEVFAPHEWFAALWSRGIRPVRHERLAERMPSEQLLDWMKQVHAQVQSLAKQRVPA